MKQGAEKQESQAERGLGRRYRKGETIFRQGEASHQFHIVQQGRVLMTRETPAGKTIRMEIGPGEIFGIASVFTANRVRFATATAMEDCRILGIDETLFISRLHQDPSIAFRIIRHLSQRLFEVGQGNHGCAKGSKKAAPRKLLNVHDFSVGYHFLIVEDDPDLLVLIREWLDCAEGKAPGPTPLCRLTHAATFQEASTRLAGDKYDLILLDLNLADSKGYQETFLRIRDLAIDTPIIVFTAMDDDRQALQAVEEGAQDYLVKGQVDQRHFMRAIRHALARHGMHRASTEETEESSVDDGDRKFTVMLRNWLNRCIKHD
ncbi:MAG: cyclic nucleotide-binding domain-containing protein [Magnetococcales bacterium]|nr:cyclic nucleotide-binding domain-containing protein [Magnetococcales bacterium]